MVEEIGRTVGCLLLFMEVRHNSVTVDRPMMDIHTGQQ